MQDKIYINQLLDYYSPLLTKNQQDICNLYYRCDLSLSEIAEEESISRSAVHDTVNRCQKELERYESILQLAKKHEMRKMYLDELKETVLDATQLELLQKISSVDTNDHFE